MAVNNVAGSQINMYNYGHTDNLSLPTSDTEVLSTSSLVAMSRSPAAAEVNECAAQVRVQELEAQLEEERCNVAANQNQQSGFQPGIYTVINERSGRALDLSGFDRESILCWYLVSTMFCLYSSDVVFIGWPYNGGINQQV
jgi:hypothetical protein